MSPIGQWFRRTGGALLGIVAIVFVAELAIMAVLVRAGLSLSDPLIVLLDGLVLVTIVVVPVYRLMVLPLRREHDKLLSAERRARDLNRLAMSDPLTGVLNRRGILARLLEAMAHAERYDRQLSVAMLDLDRFKAVNDRNGHAFGDEVLCRMADQFSEALRASDLVGRLGGDEFLVVLPETGLDFATAWAERVRRRVGGAELMVDEEAVRMAVSIGVTELVAGERLGGLLERVDRALYCAKELGRPGCWGAVSPRPH